ncbi:Transposase DDE domain [uncultured Eubacterium sp.]|nr:Transposase DDE domain [uncultured Eubacterium sp.]
MKPEKIYERIKDCVRRIEARREDYVSRPGKDFTRTRKISFYDCMMSVICMHGGTLFSEILEYFSRDAGSTGLPTVSAYLQQRAKIKQSTFEELFASTTNLNGQERYHHGYRLLAADGSDVQVPTNPEDEGTYFPGTNGQRPYNLIHLNALYDILSNTYQDVIVQDRYHCAEQAALNRMVDDSSIGRAIVIADRGYESYNVMAHIQEKGWRYLIRVKDIGGNGIVSRLDLPDAEEFDIRIDLQVTRKNSKETGELFKDRNSYRYAPPNSRLDYLPARSVYKEDAVFYRIPFRAVRFRIREGQHETVVTNLPEDGFPAAELKELYAMRWGIETSFRTLKYNVGMLCFHSVKKGLVLQELFARLAFFNITACMSSVPLQQQSERKYAYKVNVSNAVLICRKLFLERIPPRTAYGLIVKSVVPIRNNRSFERKAHSRIAINFICRIS